MLKIKTFISFILAFLVSTGKASAQSVINLEDPASPFHNLYNLRPGQYVRTSILWLIGGSGVAAFIFLLLGGFQWITSGGDKDAAEKARKKIIFALTGLAIVFSAYAIVFILRALFQVDLLEFRIANLGN